ncbi:MAG: hypothetical protein EOP00_12605 [Pedobacter sp.]|nr:MAG: hypothetical protein EOP00_12605 [Pedobacter sp.]
MKIIILSFIILSSALSVFSQKIDTNKIIGHTYYKGLRKNYKSKAAIVLNDIIFKDSQILDLINPNDIEDISVLNGRDSEAKFGSVGKNGTLIIKTKKKLKLIKLDKLFKKFKVAPNNRLFDVYIEGQKIIYKYDFLVHPKWVNIIWLRKDTVGGPNLYLQLSK